jgi:hypothetical protein
MDSDVYAAAEAMKAVNGSLGLRRNFTFNIQGFAFSRKFLGELQADGAVFRSPFPDYYLANVVFAKLTQKYLSSGLLKSFAEEAKRRCDVKELVEIGAGAIGRA